MQGCHLIFHTSFPEVVLRSATSFQKAKRKLHESFREDLTSRRFSKEDFAPLVGQSGLSLLPDCVLLEKFARKLLAR